MVVTVWVKEKLFHGPDIIYKESIKMAKYTKILIINFLLINILNGLKCFDLLHEGIQEDCL